MLLLINLNSSRYAFPQILITCPPRCPLLSFYQEIRCTSSEFLTLLQTFVIALTRDTKGRNQLSLRSCICRPQIRRIRILVTLSLTHLLKLHNSLTASAAFTDGMVGPQECKANKGSPLVHTKFPTAREPFIPLCRTLFSSSSVGRLQGPHLFQSGGRPITSPLFLESMNSQRSRHCWIQAVLVFLKAARRSFMCSEPVKKPVAGTTKSSVILLIVCAKYFSFFTQQISLTTEVESLLLRRRHHCLFARRRVWRQGSTSMQRVPSQLRRSVETRFRVREGEKAKRRRARRGRTKSRRLARQSWSDT